MTRQATQYRDSLESGGLAIRYSPAMLTPPFSVYPDTSRTANGIESTKSPLISQSYPHTPPNTPPSPQPRRAGCLSKRPCFDGGHSIPSPSNQHKQDFLPYAHIAVSIKEGYMCITHAMQHPGNRLLANAGSSVYSRCAPRSP